MTAQQTATSDWERWHDALVELGAHKVAHADEPLIGHLKHTCSLLQRMRCEPHVCVAGLFHGVYGTQALHSESMDIVPEARREQVAALIGGRSERLVYCFSAMRYESVGRSLRNVLRGGDPDLRSRLDDGALPVDRGEFDDLLRLKLGDVLAHVPARIHWSALDLPAEYGAFWQLVAEHLGPDCVRVWNGVMGERQWIAA